MIKQLLTFFILCPLFTVAFSQGYSLKFNRALTINNVQQTVPVNKVWKVTSIYGVDRVCIPCIPNEHTPASSCSGRFVDYVGSSFFVNGNLIISQRDWDPPAQNYGTIYSNNTCTSGYDTFSSTSFGWGYFDVEPNYNILPMWLAAGTTLQTNTSNIFLSVIEFEIIP